MSKKIKVDDILKIVSELAGESEYIMDKKKELDRMREYMCAHFRNCEGCPISEAARKVKLRCTDFRRKKPNEVEFIIRTWKHENTPVRSE